MSEWICDQLDRWEGVFLAWTFFWMFVAITVGIPLVTVTAVPVIVLMSIALAPFVVVIPAIFALIFSAAIEDARNSR